MNAILRAYLTFIIVAVIVGVLVFWVAHSPHADEKNVIVPTILLTMSIGLSGLPWSVLPTYVLHGGPLADQRALVFALPLVSTLINLTLVGAIIQMSQQSPRIWKPIEKAITLGIVALVFTSYFTIGYVFVMNTHRALVHAAQRAHQ